jgi:hypothetical protein
MVTVVNLCILWKLGSFLTEHLSAYEDSLCSMKLIVITQFVLGR